MMTDRAKNGRRRRSHLGPAWSRVQGPGSRVVKVEGSIQIDCLGGGRCFWKRETQERERVM